MADGSSGPECQVLTTEPMAVYGIWMPSNDNRRLGDWLILSDGEIFHTIHRAVAEAQLQYVKSVCDIKNYSLIAVREFLSPID